MAQVEKTRDLAGARGALNNDPEFYKAIVEVTIQRVLELEMAEHLQASPFKRTDARWCHRNGYKPCL